MLTRKQSELLRFIHERLKETGVPPSFDEMKEALDLASKSGIHRLITALEERGFLRRMEKRARALEVLKLPDNMAETLRPATTRSQVQRAGIVRCLEGDVGQRQVATFAVLVAGDKLEDDFIALDATASLCGRRSYRHRAGAVTDRHVRDRRAARAAACCRAS